MLNTRFLLALLDHGTSNYFWQYDLWWSHYWSCHRYDLATLTPSKNKMSVFIIEFQKARFVMFRSRSWGHGVSPNSIKMTLKLVFDGSPIILQQYKKTNNYSLWGQWQEMRTLNLWLSVTCPDLDRHFLLLTSQRIINCIIIKAIHSFKAEKYEEQNQSEWR